MGRQQRRQTGSTYRIYAGITAEGDPPPVIGLAIHHPSMGAGAAAVVVPLTLGEAYELGRDLVDVAQGFLAGQKRPWDDAPERPPFVSRRSSRAGGRASARTGGAPGAPRARSRAVRDGYPRARRIRPERGVESDS